MPSGSDVQRSCRNIGWVRTLTPERARAIGKAGFRRVLIEHTYAHRGAEVDALLRAEMARRLDKAAA